MAYGCFIDRDVEVPMRDGTLLSVDIYRPARAGRPVKGRFPAILERGPHGKGGIERTFVAGEYLARHGYIALIQDCRGCFASQGDWYPERDEEQDGHDTLTWIASQPWSNGRIGLHGTSYQGLTAIAAAASGSGLVAATWAHQPLDNANLQTTRNGGALELWHICWVAAVGALIARRAGERAFRHFNTLAMQDWLRRLPFNPGLSPFTPLEQLEHWYFDQLQAGPADVEAEIERWAARIDAPLYLTGGWFDTECASTLERFTAVRQRGQAPAWLLVGPWTHGRYAPEGTVAGTVDFGPEAARPDFTDSIRSWFDHWLKDEPTHVEPAVQLFVMGGGSGRRTSDGHLAHGGRWRSESDWPLTRARHTTFHLHPGGQLLPDQPSAASTSTNFLSDPANPVPTLGGSLNTFHNLAPPPEGIAIAAVPFSVRGETFEPSGPLDQRERPGIFMCRPPYLPLNSRGDVISFQTAPLEQALEVTGAATVTLFVSSSAGDTDFTAKLIDLYPASDDWPDGFAMNLCDSIVRMRFREPGRARPTEPNRIYEIEIALGPTANLFAAGHRIRIDIASSNFPRFDVNPNSYPDRAPTVAINTIHHNRANPSRVVLPIIADG